MKPNERLQSENLLNNTKTMFFSLRLAGLSLLLGPGSDLLFWRKNFYLLVFFEGRGWRKKKLILVLSPRPGPDVPNASGWYRRLREPISPFSMFSSVQLHQLFSRGWTILLSTIIHDLDSRITAKYSKCKTNQNVRPMDFNTETSKIPYPTLCDTHVTTPKTNALYVCVCVCEGEIKKEKERREKKGK